MASRKASLLKSLQKEQLKNAKSDASNKLSELTSSYLNGQEALYGMESEPDAFEKEMEMIQEPLATAETINFQLEREKKKVTNALNQDENTLKRLGTQRVELESDGVDSLLDKYFSKIDLSSDSMSLSDSADNVQGELEAKVSDLRAEKSSRLSQVKSPSNNCVGIPFKKILLRNFKVNIKNTNSELINNKLYLRRINAM